MAGKLARACCPNDMRLQSFIFIGRFAAHLIDPGWSYYCHHWPLSLRSNRSPSTDFIEVMK
jgi:hypothetical protein